MLSTKFQNLYKAILFLSLLLILFFHGHGNCLIPDDHSSKHVITPKVNNKYRDLMVHRKVLSAAKFDFTPFLHHLPTKPDPPGKDIDQFYREEKRRVPTGPNPLHH
ncbi:hypothetical protein CDL15_Pgr008748 [Punica granatum]|uniref:CLAVATA3/ESR (CLE)-related protein 12-like n=1 Tax=Punica granatum TaxID=22663 RepID=A0A218VYR7_PUNGR|nr:hypothetical protein CDL15_Pgr008748 [Punica granatum]